MNPNTPFERDLEQWLQTEAPASAPAGFHASVMDRARTLRQRPGWFTFHQLKGWVTPGTIGTGRRPSPICTVLARNVWTIFSRSSWVSNSWTAVAVLSRNCTM